MVERVGDVGLTSNERGIIEAGNRGVAVGEDGSEEEGDRAVDEPDSSLA